MRWTRKNRDWETFLATASEEDLAKARWEYTQQIRDAKRKKLEIQAEVDRRVAENPPDPGLVIQA